MDRGAVAPQLSAVQTPVVGLALARAALERVAVEWARPDRDCGATGAPLAMYLRCDQRHVLCRDPDMTRCLAQPRATLVCGTLVGPERRWTRRAGLSSWHVHHGLLTSPVRGAYCEPVPRRATSLWFAQVVCRSIRTADRHTPNMLRSQSGKRALLPRGHSSCCAPKVIRSHHQFRTHRAASLPTSHTVIECGEPLQPVSYARQLQQRPSHG
jgi:hypothetical protein